MFQKYQFIFRLVSFVQKFIIHHSIGYITVLGLLTINNNFIITYRDKNFKYSYFLHYIILTIKIIIYFCTFQIPYLQSTLKFDLKIRSSNCGHCLQCLILTIVRLADQPIGVLGEDIGEHDRFGLLIVHPVL